MIEYATKKEADAAVAGANETDFLEQQIHVYVLPLSALQSMLTFVTL